MLMYVQISTCHRVKGHGLVPPGNWNRKFLVKRPIPYYPSENGGITPLDYVYEMPTEYYNPLVDGFEDFSDWPTDNEEIGDNYNEHNGINIIESQNNH